MDPRILAELRAELARPHPLDEVRTMLQMDAAWLGWTFERQLWFLRVKTRWTQERLALESGVAQASISKLERGGDGKLSTLKALFAALGYELMILPDTPGRQRAGVNFARTRRPRGSGS